jgi:hypothetical protein
LHFWQKRTILAANNHFKSIALGLKEENHPNTIREIMDRQKTLALLDKFFENTSSEKLKALVEKIDKMNAEGVSLRGYTSGFSSSFDFAAVYGDLKSFESLLDDSWQPTAETDKLVPAILAICITSWSNDNGLSWDQIAGHTQFALAA